MTGAGMVIGFALVFVLTAWTVSALLFLGLRAGGQRVRRFGPAAERRITALAALLPVVLGAAVVATLVVRSVVGDDHCAVHDHHAHLCITHGGAWADRPWAIALVAAAAAILIVRIAFLGGVLLRGQRAIARLRATSRQVGDVRIVESSRPFCFVAGMRRSEIYASTAAWDGLDPEERDAMLAHERGHVRHRDLALRTALELLAAFGAPLTPAPLLARWEHATERLRDRDAADAVGSPEAVAGAMVHMCRLGAQPAGAGLAGFATAPVALEDRVDALLASSPRGDRAATVLAAVGLAVIAVMTLAVATNAEPLHHALESLLG